MHAALRGIGTVATGAGMEQACGPQTAGLLIFVYGIIAMVMMLPPLIYIAAKRRVPWSSKWRWLLGLAAVALASMGVASLFVSEGGDELVKPWPWVAMVAPAYVLAWYFRKVHCKSSPP